MSEEIKKLQDEVANLVSNVQSELKAREDKFGEAETKFDETIEAMTAKAAESAEKLQELNDGLEAEKKAREELELAMARAQKSGDKEEYGDPEYKQTFNNRIRRLVSGIEVDLQKKEVEKMFDFYAPNAQDYERDIAVKTLLAGSQPDGGYYVPVDQLRDITERVFETSPMRQLSTVMTTANNSITIGIDDEEIDSGWRSEVAPVTETGTPQVAELEINTHELWAMPKASQRLLDDASVDMESWLSNKLSTKFTRQENAAFVNGDGNGKPRGFTVLPAWGTAGTYERGKLENVPGGTATQIVGDDLINLQATLLEDYQQGAVFGGHRLTWAVIVKLKDGQGQYLISPTMLFSGTSMQLLGQPFRFFADLPKPSATGVYTAGQLPVVYANFSEGYTIVDRMGIRIIRDNITEKGFVKWYTTKRTGGDVTNYQAIKRLVIT